jgi:hypothetical protein
MSQQSTINQPAKKEQESLQIDQASSYAIMFKWSVGGSSLP